MHHLANAIVDSNVFIAVWHKRDEHNEQAIGILKKLADGEIQHAYITNYVLVEVINFLIKKVPFEIVLEAFTYLTQTARIKIVYADKIMEHENKSVFLKYKTLTLTDCSLVTLAHELGMKTVYSFDSGFDKVKEVERREE